jgi:2Fe-2S ferredoxin
MPRITYVQPDGTRKSIDAVIGANVMLEAVMAGISGILAECGGSAMCATCHVYLQDDCANQVSEKSTVEQEMLSSVSCKKRPGSRLSCQLILNDNASEVVVQIPDTQI